MVIEDVVTILKGDNHFSIQRTVFPAGGENADFLATDAVSKFNTCHGNLPVMNCRLMSHCYLIIKMILCL